MKIIMYTLENMKPTQRYYMALSLYISKYTFN